MQSVELTDLADQAERLLWMLVRYDVEGLSDQRRRVLGRLRELESRAGVLGVPDLYTQVLQNTAPKFIKWWHDEG